MVSNNNCFKYKYYYSQAALKRGAVSVHEPWEETDDDGMVTFATVQTVSVKLTSQLCSPLLELITEGDMGICGVAELMFL